MAISRPSAVARWRAASNSARTPCCLAPPPSNKGNGSATPKQLAQTLGIPPPNVTVLLDRLVERALMQRERSPTDGRAMNLRLTDKGAELARRVQRVSQTMEAGLLAPLSAGERAMLAELLHKLVHIDADAAPG